MHPVRWIAFAIGTLGLSVVTVMLGMNLLPTGEVAQTKGTYVPWVITWLIIWGTVLAGVVLAGFMIMYGTGKIGSD